MALPRAVQYRVVVKKDPDTGSVVAEIPAPQLATMAQTSRKRWTDCRRC